MTGVMPPRVPGPSSVGLGLFCVSLSVLLLVLDTFAPLGIAAGVPQAFVVMVALWAPWRPLPLAIAALATVVVLLGALLSPSVGIEGWVVGFNRAVAIATVWSVAMLGVKLRRSEDQVRNTAEELGRRATELEDANAQLATANRDLEGFSYSVSHDLRAPLRAIDGYGRILAEDHEAHLDDEGQRILEVIRRNTTRMGRLIDDLLAFSRSSRTELRPLRVDMTRAARDAFELVREAEADREIELTMGALPPAMADRALITQVWSNLLSNAAKYSRGRSPAHVEVRGRDEGDEVVYEVEDDGVGFDERYQDKLFQVFSRLHSSSEFEGTGVGLALVRRVVERHGGRVWARGTPDAGATFSFSLPRRPSNDD